MEIKKRGRPRKVQEEKNTEEIKTEVEFVNGKDTETLSPKEALETRLFLLNSLREDMKHVGVDSIGKLDVLAAQCMAEISKMS